MLIPLSLSLLVLAFSDRGAAASLAAYSPAAAQRSPHMSQAAGTFEVQMTPIPPDADTPADAPGRMRLVKTFRGDLEATGLGEMLGIHDGKVGAYVAMERVKGRLNGRAGGFALAHRGVMDADGQALLITIVPGSGSGELAGISGVFHLTIVDGEHRYVLEYSLPDGV